MVELGKIPQPVRVPFVRIRPAIAGEFRWSGTTVLIFTPDRSKPLPYATKFEVIVDAGATGVSGRKLAAPYRFTFTTPTVKLLETNWYRRNKRVGDPVVIVLRVQPARGAGGRPQARDARVRAARFHAADAHRCRARTDEGDRPGVARAVRREGRDGGLRGEGDDDGRRRACSRLGQETISAIARARGPAGAVMPPDSWLRVTVRPDVPSPAGPETPGRSRSSRSSWSERSSSTGSTAHRDAIPSVGIPPGSARTSRPTRWRKAVSVDRRHRSQA